VRRTSRRALLGGSLALALAASTVVSILGGSASGVVAAKTLIGRESVAEYQPTIGPNFIAWEQLRRRTHGKFDVYARASSKAKGKGFRVNKRRMNAALGDIDAGDVLVFQEYNKRRSDLVMYDLAQKKRLALPRGVNTRALEYWPSLSDPWLLFARRSGPTRTMFLFNLDTREERQVDRLHKGFTLLPGQVNGDWAVWQRCRSARRCQVVRYRISSETKEILPNAMARGIAPSVAADGTAYYVRAAARCGDRLTFVRQPLNGRAKQLMSLPNGNEVATSDVAEANGDATTVAFDRFKCKDPKNADAWSFVDQEAFRLNVDPPNHGTITSDPNGITCPGDCTELYTSGTNVHLDPNPDTGYSFDHWTGDCAGRIRTNCSVTMNAARSVGVVFSQDAPPPPDPPRVTGFNPGHGAWGDPVTILGSSLNGATKVTFAGTEASIDGNNATSVDTTVPTGAISGRICVTTPVDKDCSNDDFMIDIPLTGPSGPSGP
jgi:hypothetical protein